jgi:hypothetical protein
VSSQDIAAFSFVPFLESEAAEPEEHVTGKERRRIELCRAQMRTDSFDDHAASGVGSYERVNARHPAPGSQTPFARLEFRLHWIEMLIRFYRRLRLVVLLDSGT